MNRANRIGRIFFIFASAALLLALANSAQAKDRAWNVGLGSTSGALTYESGTEKDASGFVFNFGYAFNKFIAIEGMHTSTDLDTASLAGSTWDVNVSAINFGARAMLPLGPLEIFGRFGFGTYIYTETQDTAINSYSNSYGGSGKYTGFGAAVTVGRLGIEAGIIQHKFNVTGTTSSGFSVNEDLTYKAATVILSIQFGRDLK